MRKLLCILPVYELVWLVGLIMFSHCAIFAGIIIYEFVSLMNQGTFSTCNCAMYAIDLTMGTKLTALFSGNN